MGPRSWGRVRGVQDVRRHLRSRRLRARGRQGSVLRDVLVAGTDDVRRQRRAVGGLRHGDVRQQPQQRLRHGEALPGLLHGGSLLRGAWSLGRVQEAVLQAVRVPGDRAYRAVAAGVPRRGAQLCFGRRILLVRIRTVHGLLLKTRGRGTQTDPTRRDPTDPSTDDQRPTHRPPLPLPRPAPRRVVIETYQACDMASSRSPAGSRPATRR